MNTCCCNSPETQSLGAPEIITSKLTPDMTICKKCLKTVEKKMKIKKPVDECANLIHKNWLFMGFCPKCFKGYHKHDYINVYKDGKTGWLRCR
jgi:hypothetical protein